MKNLFSPGGLQLLEAFCLNRSLLAFDFDGTLARIVENPDEAHLSSRTRSLLSELSRHAPVAIVSGRSRIDVTEKLGLDLSLIVGNHGLEGIPHIGPVKEKARSATEKWTKSLRSALESLQGVELENKIYSLSVHYRKSRSKGKVKKDLGALLQKLKPLPRIIPGKCVFNVVPQGAPHKGIALMEMMAKLKKKSALYIGDDDTDEDVFGLPLPHLLTVRVGKRRGSKAAFFIERQSDVDRLLERVVTFTRGRETGVHP